MPDDPASNPAADTASLEGVHVTQESGEHIEESSEFHAEWFRKRVELQNSGYP